MMLRRRLLRALAVALCLAAPGESVASTRSADAVDEALARWDVDAAERALPGVPEGAQRLVKAGIIAAYRGAYREAEAHLSLALALAGPDRSSPWVVEAQQYLALARGAQKALSSGVKLRSDDGTVELVLASERDALLAPYLFAAMARARAVLATELGVVPDHAVRFEFLDDPRKLAMVTPLTVENIRTTGTVGVTKHRRIVMITPRVMLQGYGWLDTAVHEYVHYLLTLRTGNQAPVWLQEGLAKLFETRWRTDAAPQLDRALAFRLRQAIVHDNLVTLEEMYPSLAMLPSAERAAVAYAEVETMVGLLRERKGPGGITALLDKVARGVEAKTALSEVWGGGFDSFLAEWTRVMKVRTVRGRDGELSVPKFKDETDAPEEPELGDVFSQLGGGRARQHARIGLLLQGRGHLGPASWQYEKARAADTRARRDPALCRRLGKVYVELEAWAKAAPLLTIAAADAPEDANLAAAQAHALLGAGDRRGARAAASRAVRNNPFIPTLHCDLAELAEDPVTAARERALCRP